MERFPNRSKSRPLFPTLLLLPSLSLLISTHLSGIQANTEAFPSECNVNDPLTCSQQKHEVCIFLNGAYKCACPQGYGRLPDGRCLVVNECEDPRLNECSRDAQCTDLAEGYMCQCKPGFADVSPKNGRAGSVCRILQDECSNPRAYGVDCDQNAVCVDTPGGYELSEQFSRLPGRKCVMAVNECEDPEKNDCSENAKCTDAKDGYTCTCHPGFVDASANAGKYPGRICNKPNEKPREERSEQCDPNQSNSCPMGQICKQFSSSGHYTCQCGDGSVMVDGQCQATAACQVDPECDKNAICINVLGSYTCQCKPGFFDVDSVTPGRECKPLSNECADPHDCSPYSKCVDNKDGYECFCSQGYTDVSSQFGLQPGRKCVNSSNECADRSLHTCDENADCIDTPQGYSCQCFPGYVDVSSNAHLPPGRACTVQTSCPKQKTDLIFLIDGSGSIGSQVFRHEMLRFIKDFIELFDIGLDNTRVGLIQYSDQIRYEFNLNQYSDKQELLQAVDQTEYLTGLTRTGAAIQHMAMEGFSASRGVRPLSEGANRVAVVITDGRSQDNVTQPAISAREHQVVTFAIGVTDHVSTAELENIAGSPNRWFFVKGFKDLDMRLRSLVQKLACPAQPMQVPYQESTDGCNPDMQTGCDRALGQICVLIDGSPVCQCPSNFPAHPETKVCGGDLCNAEVATSCPYPEYCQRTPLGNARCTCPSNFARDPRTGTCVNTQQRLPPATACPVGKTLNARTGNCLVPSACDPSDANSCDLRKRERCLPALEQVPAPPAPPGLQSYNGRGKQRDAETYETRHQIHNAMPPHTLPEHTCQCTPGEKRHPVTGVCLRNECLRKEDNECDKSNAQCVDTDESYICVCLPGYLDNSPDKTRKPGRVCTAQQNECELGTARCSPHADCIDTPEGYVCRCQQGYVDFSPNPQHASGLDCKQQVNECATGRHTCSRDATCIDTWDAYKCVCNAGFQDADELRNPGRHCMRAQETYAVAPPAPIYATRAPPPPPTYARPPPPTYARPPPTYARPPAPTYATRPPPPPPPPPTYATRPPPPPPPPPTYATPPAAPPARDCTACGSDCCYGKLGEICVDEEKCECPAGQKRASPDDVCRVVECFTFPVWVVRKYQSQLQYNDSFATPSDSIYKQYVSSFENGARQSYLQTPLRDAFVVSEVGDVVSPAAMNGSWNHGVIYNSSMCFRTGKVPNEQTAYTTFIRWIIDHNSYQVGQSGQYLNPYQPNPFSPCYQNNCHPNSTCIETGTSTYRCECLKGFRDMSPANPGHDCVPEWGINECENATLNDCKQNSRCIDLDHLYRCECLQGFRDASPAGAVPQSICITDYCSDVNYCSANSTGQNLADECQCQCKPGYKDLRNTTTQQQRLDAGLKLDEYCLLGADINECLLGMHNCSDFANCTDLREGYTCICWANYTDMHPEMPGRDCQPPAGALFAPGAGGGLLSWLLPLLLAILFLLLTLCCCLWALSRMRWLGGAKKGFAASDDSLYGPLTIPRARLDEDLGSLASSEYTIREEVERRVTTEVTRTEEEIAGGETTYAEEEQVGDRAHTFSQSHAASYYGGGGGGGGLGRTGGGGSPH